MAELGFQCFFFRWDTPSFHTKWKRRRQHICLEILRSILISRKRPSVVEGDDISQYFLPTCKTESNISLLRCQYVDHRIVILSHHRDYSNFGFGEKTTRKKHFTFIKGNVNAFPLHFGINSYFPYSYSLVNVYLLFFLLFINETLLSSFRCCFSVRTR